MELYTYRAQCCNVVDGDTVDLYVDCGFHTYKLLRFRLLGIDTPELNSKIEAERAKAVEAKLFMIETLKPAPFGDNWPLIVQTSKADSFGRWLCSIWLANSIDTDVAAELLTKGLAVPFKK